MRVQPSFDPSTLSGDVSATSGGVVSVTDLSLASEARGDIARRGASAWQRVSAKASGTFVGGDGTDVGPLTMGNHATLDGAGNLTLADPHRLYRAQITLNKDGSGADGAIVGSSAGQLAASSGANTGVQVVAAPGSNKFIIPVVCYVAYTRVTASYGGGGTVRLLYVDSGGVQSGTVSGSSNAAATFAATGSSTNVWFPVQQLVDPGAGSAALWLNSKVVIQSSGAFTQPGTAAGTAVVTFFYHIGSIV